MLEIVAMAYSNVLVEVSSLSCGSVAAAQEREEVAGKERVELQEEVVDSHVQMEVEWLGGQS